nr:hypothetical protein [Tanacetum cinerariifolium]
MVPSIRAGDGYHAKLPLRLTCGPSLKITILSASKDSKAAGKHDDASTDYQIDSSRNEGLILQNFILVSVFVMCCISGTTCFGSTRFRMILPGYVCGSGSARFCLHLPRNLLTESAAPGFYNLMLLVQVCAALED